MEIMDANLIIIDNFYSNVDEVRRFALSQEFSVRGNYPGNRTHSFLTDSTKNTINKILYSIAGNVTNWHLDENNDGYTGAFQLCSSQDRTWIHADRFNMWAGICYLTPNAPVTGGTALYRHKQSGERVYIENSEHEKDPYDYTTWEIVDRVGNIYNRLVLYPGSLYHASIDYFGNNTENSRLFQTFFFDTEY
jgi:hypothetical protein